jgi:hypothetical protein
LRDPISPIRPWLIKHKQFLNISDAFATNNCRIVSVKISRIAERSSMEPNMKEISGSHGGEYENNILLGYSDM